MVNMGKLVKVEGKITNALGMSQGLSKASGQMAADVVHQNSTAQINLSMDNS